MDTMVLNQADGVNRVERQVLNSDLPASQQYNFLSEAEERQADEHIAAWEQYNVPWTLGSYLDSLQQSTQTPLAFDYSFPSSSVKPDGHYGQPPDRLIDAGTGQMPATNANRRKVPKPFLAGPAKRQAASRLPAHVDTVVTYTLPTGEITSERQKSRRLQFVDFPPITQPLPEDVEDEDIIKHWPNHLWGSLLLRLAEKWKPQQISHMTPVNLKANTLWKRLAVARIQGGEELPKTRWRRWKLFAREGKPLDEHQLVSQPAKELKHNHAFRMDNAGTIELEDVRQSNRHRKRRK